MELNKGLLERRKHRNNRIFKTLKLTIFIFCVIAIYNMFLVIVSTSYDKSTTSLFGYSAYIITTDSMKPTLNSQDVIITQKSKGKGLKKDDIITFRKDTEIITHRIISKDDSGYITKGDNNNVEDLSVVKSDEIIGVKVLRIPYLGKIIKMVNNIFYIIIIIIIIITIFLYNRRKTDKSVIRRKKKRLEDEKEN